LAQDSHASAASHLFARVAQTPAVQALARRLETGGALAWSGVSTTAQPFFAALLHHLFPQRPIVLVADNLKTQESFQQDLATWLAQRRESKVDSRGQQASNASSSPRPSTLDPRLLFYPAWENLPHEGKLPHADVISERLETLVALSSAFSLQPSAFDRILVDAPCSNTGVMRRRVDLRWRIQPKEIERLRAAQLDLLQSAAPRVKPGGVLVYSTCSLEPEENQEVVKDFLRGQADFKLESERELLPFVDNVDGAYVARLKKG
jgi:hypothetical protein